MAAASVNFGFLAKHSHVLADDAARAERYFRDDPRTCVATLRTLAEGLAKHAAAYSGVFVERDELSSVLSRLRERGVFDAGIGQLFRTLRENGNDAVHAGTPGRPPRTFSHHDALQGLRMARDVAIWFHVAFGDPKFKAGPFVTPPDPHAPDPALMAELDRLRALETALDARDADAAEKIRLGAAAESRAAAAYADLERSQAAIGAAHADTAAARADVDAALSLAEAESAARLAEAAGRQADRAVYEALLAELQTRSAAAPEATARTIEAARTASVVVDLDEPATREIIDAQLRDAGWEAHSTELRYARGTRPTPGRNLAIAEWPTASGPADYALFVGTTLIGIVEAKKRAVDVMSALDQARRYAAAPRLDGAPTAGGPWDPTGPFGPAVVPFVFATNGRPYLNQLRTRSGVWFRDLRRASNPSLPLDGWKTPEGLQEALRTDVDAAEAALAAEPTDYLVAQHGLGLREYQIRAIRAVEAAIAAGDREVLVAMATGTGKTRTCIGLVYRLIKSRRFRRVLFLVDRTTLGDQAADAFETDDIENFQPFTGIYDVKRLSDTAPGPDTKLHFATVQGMVRRLAADAAGDTPLPVDAYDCIVVDESHRGYHLDREMSEGELTFRDAADYVSQYRRVLDHFDAVRIGLTATPALHTVDIFGDPVFVYSYREAVVDGFLVDHEPPFRVNTKLARDGITFAADTDAPAWDKRAGQETLFHLPDEVRFGIEDFNRDVVTVPFNRAVVDGLVHADPPVDPFRDGKTLVFAVDNDHADVLVHELRTAFRAEYGDLFEDDLVAKITGKVDRVDRLIRRFRNERAPNVGVTVDLLTTGVDIPKIDTLVFVRRVGSRILFDQMRGRATRLCPEIGKEAFRIYDAVGLFDAMKDFTDMKPVVQDPKIPFATLVGELSAVDPSFRDEVLDQLIAKLQRKKTSLRDERLEAFTHLAGADPASVIAALRSGSPADAAAWFAARPDLAAWLDEKVFGARVVLVAEHDDEHLGTAQDVADPAKAADYLDAFRAWLDAHGNDLPALKVVTTRPRELTRKQLRELKLALDAAGYGEKALQTAYAARTNRAIAASIVGYIRQQALGSPLEPYDRRVERALDRILAKQPWTRVQREWLERIGSQLRREIVVDREALDADPFRAKGGWRVIDKAFDGHLDEVLADLHDAIWQDAR